MASTWSLLLLAYHGRLTTIAYGDTTTFGVQLLYFTIALSLCMPILYVLRLFICELAFSPLARYPGPLLAQISPLHNVYHALKKDIHLDIWKQHQTYGKSESSGIPHR